MQIPLPLARLGASSACFLSNGEGQEEEYACLRYKTEAKGFVIESTTFTYI
jgi:hypothetical protein